MQCFENFGGDECPKCPPHPGCTPVESELLRNQNFDQLIHDLLAKSTQSSIVVWVSDMVGKIENVSAFLSLW